jgi:hypothetical protein
MIARSTVPLTQTSDHAESCETSVGSQNETFRKIGVLNTVAVSKHLDYALFELNDDYSQFENTILLPKIAGYPRTSLKVREIAKKIINTDVWAATSRNGVVRGKLLDNPYYFKMAGTSEFQKMWPLEMEKNIRRSLVALVS